LSLGVGVFKVDKKTYLHSIQTTRLVPSKMRADNL
jgi:hypothetical protein